MLRKFEKRISIESIVDYNSSSIEYFSISNVGNCSSAQDYGFQDGQPCILIKMNKVNYSDGKLLIGNTWIIDSRLLISYQSLTK